MIPGGDDDWHALRDGYIAFGRCWSCGRGFTFHPDRVPSVPIDPETNTPPDLGGSYERSVLQPICSTCVELSNEQRKAMGRPDLIYVPPGAYPDQ